MKINRLNIFLTIGIVLAGCASTTAGAPAALADPGRTDKVSAGALFARGLALADSGRLIRAEQYLSLAGARGYPEQQTIPALIRVCLAGSRLRAALNYAEPYLTRHPRAWSLRYLVASIQLALGRPERAREELRRVVVQQPAHAPAHYLLAVVMRDAFDDAGSAGRSFSRYLDIEPRGEHAQEALAWLREHEPGRSESAKAIANAGSHIKGGAP